MEFNYFEMVVRLHLMKLLLDVVEQVRRVNSLHEKIDNVKEKWQNRQDHQNLELERKNVFNDSKVEAQKVAPYLSEGLQQLHDKQYLDWVEVQHEAIPGLQLQQFLFQFLVGATKWWLGVSLWPSHPISLHVGVEREFSSFIENIASKNQDSDDGEDGDVIMAHRGVVLISPIYDALRHDSLKSSLLFFPVLHNMMKIFNPIESKDKHQKYTVEECG